MPRRPAPACRRGRGIPRRAAHSAARPTPASATPPRPANGRNSTPVPSGDAGRDRQPRQQRHAQPARHHLHQRMQAGRGKPRPPRRRSPRQQAAHHQRLVAQAMARPPAAAAARSASAAAGTARRAASRCPGGTATKNASRATATVSAPPQSHGSASSSHVQPPARQPVDQPARGVLAQIQPQHRERLAQRRHQSRQQERPDRRDHAEPQRAAHRRARRIGRLGHRRPAPPAPSRARSTSSSPSGVNTTCLPRRRGRGSCASSWRSSASMPAESVDCVTAHACAARPKCPVLGERDAGSGVARGSWRMKTTSAVPTRIPRTIHCHEIPPNAIPVRRRAEGSSSPCGLRPRTRPTPGATGRTWMPRWLQPRCVAQRPLPRSGRGCAADHPVLSSRLICRSTLLWV